ncbi:hypothetical protein GCM10027073_13400 [Streptomyces chlorus]
MTAHSPVAAQRGRSRPRRAVASFAAVADLVAVVRADTLHNLMWTDPVLAGRYPAPNRTPGVS